jgi:hypothetical protein
MITAELIDYQRNQTITFTKTGNFQLITETMSIKFIVNIPRISTEISELTSELEKFEKICQHTDCERDIKLMKKDLDNEVFKIHDLSLSRQRRDTENPFFPSFGEFLKSTAGTLTSKDRDLIELQINTIKNNQNHIIDQSNDVKRILNASIPQLMKTEENIKRINENYEKIEGMNAAVFSHNCLLEFKIAINEIKNVVNSLFTILTTRKLQGDIIPYQTLETIFQSLKKKLEENQIFPFNSFAELLWRKRFDISIKNNTLSLIIELPAVAKESWEIFKISTWPTSRKNIVTYLDVSDKYLLRKNANLLTTMKSLSHLLRNDKGTFLGKIQKPLMNAKTDNCVTRAFRQNTIDKTLCEAFVHHAQIKNVAIIKINENELLVFPEKSLMINTKCHNETKSFNVSGNMHVRLEENCITEIDDFSFIGIKKEEETYEVDTTTINVQFNTEFNQPKLVPLVGNMIEIENLANEIKNLRNKKLEHVSEEIFTTHKKTFWASFLSLIFSAIVILALIAVICCCIKV